MKKEKVIRYHGFWILPEQEGYQLHLASSPIKYWPDGQQTVSSVDEAKEFIDAYWRGAESVVSAAKNESERVFELELSRA